MPGGVGGQRRKPLPTQLATVILLYFLSGSASMILLLKILFPTFDIIKEMK